MKTYKCLICGEVFTVEDGVEPVCPRCKATGEKLEEIKEEAEVKKWDYRARNAR